MENYISLKLIEKQLDIRIQRLQSKIKHLNFNLKNPHKLTIDQSKTLLESYIASNQTSVDTKEKAVALITQIDKGKFDTLKLKERIPRPRTTKKKKSNIHSIDQRWYISFGQSLYNNIQLFFDESVRLLTSPRFSFLVLFMAIAVQVNHSAFVFYCTAPTVSSSMWAAYGYAIMVDSFIVIIALKRKLTIAKVFAVLTFLTNLLYFRVWIDFDGTSEAYTNAASSLLISATMAYTIYSYTDIFVQLKLKND